MEPGPARRPNIITRNTTGWFLRGMLLAYEDGNDFLRVWRGGSDRGTERERVYVRVGGVGACGDGGWGVRACVYLVSLFFGWGGGGSAHVYAETTRIFIYFFPAQSTAERRRWWCGEWTVGGGEGGGELLRVRKSHVLST